MLRKNGPGAVKNLRVLVHPALMCYMSIHGPVAAFRRILPESPEIRQVKRRDGKKRFGPGEI